ncbi:MAG: hypothetical protein GOU97_04225 [Nanoarchaeota archaeon]|nr:hypothetical protein [Nanoarchaeota archaeon]
MKERILMTAMIACMLLAPVLAEGDLSMQLKTSSPGIAGVKSAELIFDVVNTDQTLKIEGFLWCNTPDNTAVASSLGAGTGAAQYVSPKFTMNTGPSQKSIELTLDSAFAGTYNANCHIKYIPYKETTTTEGNDTITTKTYLLMNGNYISESEVTDNEYRLLRLGNNFEINDPATDFNMEWLTNNWLIIAIIVIVIAVAYIGGKTARP